MVWSVVGPGVGGAVRSVSVCEECVRARQAKEVGEKIKWGGGVRWRELGRIN